jgi:hypothetical protein
VSAIACREVRRQLPWFLGDDLPVDGLAAIRSHLLGCLPCRREAAELQRAGAAYRAAMQAEVAGVDEALFGAMQQHVMAAVAGVEPAPKRSWWRPLAWSRLPSRAAMLAAAGLLVGLGFWLGGGGLGGGGHGSVWHRPGLPASTPEQVGGEQARAGGSQLPFGLRPLGVESWQRLEDASREDEAGTAGGAGGATGDDASGVDWRRLQGLGGGLTVRARLRALVDDAGPVRTGRR